LNAPWPAPESYESDSSGPNPARIGFVAIGTLIDAVPVTGVATTFSPIPRSLPPSWGNETRGAPTENALGEGPDEPATPL